MVQFLYGLGFKRNDSGRSHAGEVSSSSSSIIKSLVPESLRTVLMPEKNLFSFVCETF